MQTDENIVLFSKDQLSWGSCRTISSNLQVAYRKTKLKLHWQAVSPDEIENDLKYNTGYLDKLCRKIAQRNPKQIIFVDNEPLPPPLLRSFAYHPELSKKKFSIAVHVYGDFTLFSKNWWKANSALKNRQVRFICASDKSRNLIGNFADLKNLEICPFPVDTKFFRFDPQARLKIRKKLGLTPSHRLIIYTGRISLQKNISLLLRQFAALPPAVLQETKLAIAGGFDDLGAPLMGWTSLPGTAFRDVQNELQNMASETRQKIIFLGTLKPDQLRDHLCAADLFWSLSLYHDEDFGMSPAEALSCGLPCVLSNWGGYTSFAQNNSSVSLVPIKLKKSNYHLDEKIFVAETLRWLRTECQDSTRILRAKSLSDRFSVEAISKKLSQVYAKKPTAFKGFKKDLGVLSQKVGRNFFPVEKSFYQKIYRSYYL
jgi:glycosyltransferase involved in cell wall biosynthesis